MVADAGPVADLEGAREYEHEARENRAERALERQPGDDAAHRLEECVDRVCGGAGAGDEERNRADDGDEQPGEGRSEERFPGVQLPLSVRAEPAQSVADGERDRDWDRNGRSGSL